MALPYDERHIVGSSDPRPSIVPVPNNVPYVVAVVLMALIGMIGAVAVAIGRPGQDNTAIYALLGSFVAPTTLSLLAFMKAQETHLSVNSRLDAFMRNAEMAARVQGVLDGRAQGREAANARTDALAAQLPPPAPEVVKVDIVALPKP